MKANRIKNVDYLKKKKYNGLVDKEFHICSTEKQMSSF